MGNNGCAGEVRSFLKCGFIVSEYVKIVLIGFRILLPAFRLLFAQFA